MRRNSLSSNERFYATFYSSDDSGRGTCTASDLSDDEQFRITKGDKQRMKHHCKQQVSNDTLTDNDKVFEIERQRNNIDILKAVQCNIAHKVSNNDDEILDIIISIGQFMTYQYIEKLHWYVVDVERITLLLNSLARRLARTELKILNCNRDLKTLKELYKQHKKISEQLDDANDINNCLYNKLVIILNNIEKHLGVETKNKFVNLMDRKSKLLITPKEVDDKIKIHEVQQNL